MSGRARSVQEIADQESVHTPVPAKVKHHRGPRRGRHADTPAVGEAMIPTSQALDTPVDQDPVDPIEFLPWAAKGTKLRTSAAKAGRGFYAPVTSGGPTTTRQAEILHSAVFAAPTGVEGIINGRDSLTRTAFQHDTFTAYDLKIITSPNGILVADVGWGKSSLIKTVFLLRPWILQNRKFVIFDKKDEQGRGEYCPLLERFGVDPLSFSLDGGGVLLNPLDPQIAAVVGAGGQHRLLRTLVEHTMGGDKLDRWAEESLRTALKIASRQAETDRRPVPVLADIHKALAQVQDHESHADLLGVAKDRLHMAAVEVRFGLNGLLEEYSGMFDGLTSPSVQLGEKVTSFDISQLPPDDPAAAMVMAVANMWLLGQLRTHRGYRTTLIIEEAWDQITGPNGRLVKSNTKLARGLGLSLLAAIHKIADIPTDSPGIAILQEAQTIYLGGQRREEDRARCQEVFGLGPDAPTTLMDLDPGEWLVKIGGKPENRIRHIRSQIEQEMTNTDSAMKGYAS